MRKIILLAPLMLLSSYLLLSCKTDSEKTATKKDESSTFDKAWAKSLIDSFNAKFAAEVAAGDSVALASHYWPDAELLLDNSEVVKAKDMAASWGAFIRMGAKEMKFETTDITGNGSFLIETGNVTIKDGSNNLMDRAKYVVVWEKRNDEWKLYRDIGCTSLPR